MESEDEEALLIADSSDQPSKTKRNKSTWKSVREVEEKKDRKYQGEKSCPGSKIKRCCKFAIANWGGNK